jgi:hypothetical protein
MRVGRSRAGGKIVPSLIGILAEYICIVGVSVRSFQCRKRMCLEQS